MKINVPVCNFTPKQGKGEKNKSKNNLFVNSKVIPNLLNSLTYPGQVCNGS